MPVAIEPGIFHRNTEKMATNIIILLWLAMVWEFILVFKQNTCEIRHQSLCVFSGLQPFIYNLPVTIIKTSIDIFKKICHAFLEINP